MEYTSESGTLSPTLREQLALLCETPVGSVWMDRDLGIDRSALDLPPAEAQTVLAAELADKIERYVPPLRLDRVELTGQDLNGKYNYKVVVRDG